MKKSALIFLITVFVCVLTVMTASADFKDDFTDTDHAANGWRERLLFGMPGTEYLFPEEGKLSIHMPDYNTALYLLNENTDAADSTVELTIDHVFSRHAEVGLICRYHEDGWYELRAALSGQYAGSFILYRYDEALKAEGKNPFVSLHPEMLRYYTKDIKIGRNAQNTFKMICEEDEIRILINGKEQASPWNGKFAADVWTDGLSGFSVWSEKPYALAQIDALNFRAFFEEE